MNRNRVYVNPNFNKISNDYNASTSHANSMYLNPNFSEELGVIQRNMKISNRKIYVNPNFIKPHTTLQDPNYCNTAKNEVNWTVNNICSNPNKIDHDSKIVNLPPAISKTRYCLVRHDVDSKKENIPGVKSPKTTTIKISKYKSIRVNNVRDNFQTINNNSNNLQRINRGLICKTISTTYWANKSIQKYKSENVTLHKSRFSLKKLNTTLSSSESRTFNIKSQSPNLKKNMKIRSFPKRCKLKKNNIPCPLFTKYGKCLRNLHGNCEYLHSKKHVSVCRKFLKGICHDESCLLSHELSEKKMPTCYFYLNGICVKDNCPYLHVKLNEKTRACPDFLKGYCEKGTACSKRHDYSRSCVADKRSKIDRRNRVYSKVKINNRKTEENSDTKVNNDADKDNTIESRYFKDVVNNVPVCEIIKPSRCKLGTLPSFIQL